MVWTVSQTTTTLTLTPDGTTSANLADLLDLAISTLTTNAGVTKPSLYTYDLTKQLIIAADISSNYLYVSGLNLILRDRFIRASNSRVRFSNINVAGAVVGKANILMNIQPVAYGFANSWFTVGGSNAFVDATDFTFILRRIGTAGGDIFGGYDMAGFSVGSWANCSFQSDSDGDSSNQIFYFSSESFSDCRFTGWSACEIAYAGSLIKNCIFTTVGIIKNSFSGDYYLEGVSSSRVSAQRGGIFRATDCNIVTLVTDDPSVGPINTGNVIILQNSLQILGATGESNGLFVIRLPSNTQIYKRTLSASGLISGGNSVGATDGVSSSSERLLIQVQKIGVSGSSQVVVFDYRGAWEGVFVKYGRLPSVFSFNLQGTTATLQSVPFSSLPDTAVTTLNPATVAAYATIAINHSTSTVTISGATTQRQLHDYCALEKASFADSGLTLGGNPVAKACLPTLSTPIYNRPVGTFLYNLSIAAGATLTGSDSVTLAAGKNITLAAIGTYTTSPIEVSSTSIVTVAPGNTDLRGWLFASGSTINVSSTTAIVTVSDTTGITAGTGVTLQTPQTTISITGIPTGANAILGVIDLTTMAQTFPTITSGSATIVTNPAHNYFIACDARGYLRQSVTLAGNVPSYSFNLPNFTGLYNAGVSRSSDITFSPSTYEVIIGDGTPNLSLADVFHTIEDYLATSTAIFFSTPPYPVIVSTGSGSSRQYLFFPYDTAANTPNPVRIKPKTTNTSDPTLTDFVVVHEGSSAPLFTIFDFTAASGRTIRFQTEAVAASVTVSGSGALTTTQANQLTALNAALASSGVFSTSALANAPSGGGGSSLTQQQIRDALALATSATPVAGSIDTQLSKIVRPSIDVD